jgi:hypothetical protein
MLKKASLNKLLLLYLSPLLYCVESCVGRDWNEEHTDRRTDKPVWHDAVRKDERRSFGTLWSILCLYMSIYIYGYQAGEWGAVKQYGNYCCCYCGEQLSSQANRWVHRIWHEVSTVLEQKAFHLPQQPGSVTFERELGSTQMLFAYCMPESRYLHHEGREAWLILVSFCILFSLCI